MIKAMELKETIYNRRSVRIFEDKEVEKEKIRQIVDAAQWAPSACNKQGWKFVAVLDKARKGAIVEASKANALIKKAPVAIFVLYEKHLTEHKNSYIQSASAAIQNLLLFTHNLGLGATWLTGLGDVEAIRKELRVPESYNVIACVILGYSKETPMAPARKSIEEILSFDYFDFSDGYPFTYDVKKWPLKQIIGFRENSMCAASPKENIFSFGRPSETEKEIEFAAGELKENEKILEIMPFAGSHTAEMFKAKKFSDYHIFELSQQPVEFTRKKLLHNNIHFVPQSAVGNPGKLPYENGSFDAVIVFQKLEMLPNLEIVNEIFRILKPGGKFIASFKNTCSLYGLYYWYKFRVFNKEPIWNYGPFVPFNYFAFKRILREKFVVKKEIGITPLVFVGKIIHWPFSFFSRLIVLTTIKK